MSPAICAFCNSPRSDSAGPCAFCGTPPSVPARNLPAGTHLQNGKFTLGRVLGEGGFGITYLGTHRHLQRAVAIKELFPERATRHGTIVWVPDSQKTDFVKEKKRVLEEARVISRLDSPHIVEVHDAFLENNTAYIVMEYLEEQSLQEKIEAEGPLPPDDVHRIAMAANIMLTHNGRVVLVDFGSARPFDSGRTVRHTQIFTPDYAAPEMHSPQARFGPYTDLFCLGGTLFHALTGTPPPSDHVQNPHDELGFPIELQGPMGDAIQQALQVRVEKRPQSAAAFKSAILGQAIPIAKDEELFLAVSKGVLSEVARLLAFGANPNFQDKGGKTLLHLAVPTGSVDVVRALLKAGAEPNFQDGRGATPLHQAVSRRDMDTVRILLKANANPNLQDRGGVTPLHRAVSKGSVDAVGALLKAGAEPNFQDGRGATPLHRAVSKGSVNAVGALLKAGAEPNVQDGQGRTVLHLVEIGSPIFDVLLASGADPNIVHGDGATPLHQAVSKGSVNAVGALLKAGAEPNVRDGQGTMPLHLAVSTGDVDVVRMLLKAGANRNIQDGEGQTPLHLAELGSPIFHALLSAGAEPNIVYASGDTLLHVAVSVGLVDTVGTLLEVGADPNMRDGQGRTVLHLAEIGTSIFEILLANGADPNIQGKRKVARDGQIGPVLGVVCDRQVGCRPWIPVSALP